MRKPYLTGLPISRGLKPTKVAMAAIAMLSAAGAQAEEIAAPGPLNETKPAEVRIVSTEFGYAPAKVIVIAGRAVTLVLDNSGAETEHDLVVSAYGFRMQARAGETARKSTVFEKPGEYEYSCDLPGHRDAGMKGTLIVRAF
jgi:plastocyanin